MGLYRDLRNLLGRKSTDIVSLLLHGNGDNFDQSTYERMVDDAYRYNPIARACCDIILDNAGPVEWFLHTRGEKPEEIMSHPVLDRLAKPMPGWSRSRFIKHLVGSMLIYNKAYVYQNNVKSQMGELEPLYPGYMRPLWARNQMGRTVIVKYEYRTEDGVRYFQPEELIIFQLYTPVPEGVGQDKITSPMQAAMNYVDIMNAAARHSYRLTKNGGKPSMVLTTEGVITENQQAQIIAALDRMTSRDRDGRPAVLQGGLKPVNLGYNMVDMEWEKTDIDAARKIAAALGVPGQCVGIPGSQTYANMEQAYRALWEGTILNKYLYTIRDTLNDRLVSQYDRTLELDVNTDKIKALHDSDDAIYQRANNANFLSINQKLEMTGFPNIGAKGDVILVPAGMIPLDVLLAEPAPDTSNGNDTIGGNGDGNPLAGAY